MIILVVKKTDASKFRGSMKVIGQEMCKRFTKKEWNLAERLHKEKVSGLENGMNLGTVKYEHGATIGGL